MLLLLLLPAAALAQSTVLLTGGFNGAEGVRDGCELLDSYCIVPALPWNPATNRSERSDHFTSATEDGLILTCGGESPTGDDDFSCVALDPLTGAWTPHSQLDHERIKATAQTLPGVGVIVMGGFKQITSSVLPTGATAWQPGPDLPGTVNPDGTMTDYFGVCSVLLEDGKAMLVGGHTDTLLPGTRVAALDWAAQAWEEWPALYVSRWGHACARLGDKVIVAGGVSPFFTMYSSTTVLQLSTGEQREVGEMPVERTWFGMATLDNSVIAFGGMGPLRDGNAWGNIEVWNDEEEVWDGTEDTMATAMSSFASLVVRTQAVCGA